MRKLCDVLAASKVSSCNDSAAVHTSNEPMFKSDIWIPLNDSGKKHTGCKLHRSCIKKSQIKCKFQLISQKKDTVSLNLFFALKHMDYIKNEVNQLTCLTICMSEPMWHRSQISGLFSNRTSLIFCNIIAWLSSMPLSWFRDISNSWKMNEKKNDVVWQQKIARVFIFNATNKNETRKFGLGHK